MDLERCIHKNTCTKHNSYKISGYEFDSELRNMAGAEGGEERIKLV